MGSKEELEALRRFDELERKRLGIKSLDFDKLKYAPTVGMSDMERLEAGAGKAVSDTGLGLGQITGFVNKNTVDEAKERDAALMNTGAGVGGNILGHAGMGITPGLGLAGVGAAAKIPSLIQAGKLFLGASPTLPAAAAGMALGAGQSALQPVGSGDSRLSNILVGGAGGAAVPAIGMAARGGKGAIEPLYAGGREQILGRALNTAAGSRAPQAMNAMENAGEIIPGSLPTAGQASGNAGIASMERAARAVNPADYTDRMLDQNAARVNALRTVMGDEGQREMFEQARSQTAGKLYKAAFKQGIPESKLTPKVQAYISTLMENPYIQETLPIAKKLAKADGIDIGDTNGSLQGLHYVKLALDNQLGKAATSGLGKTELQKVASAKEQLVGLMQKLSPKYAEALGEFQAASKPINQMQIGEEVFRKSTNAQMDVRGNPTVHAEAMARTLKNGDQLAKSATGFKKAQMTSILEPEQLGTLQNVAADLSRSQAGENLGRGAGSDTIQKLAMTNLLERSGLPSGAINVPGFGRLGNFAYQNADELMRNQLAQSLLNPKDAAQLMGGATPSQQQKLLSQILRSGAAPLLTGTTVSGLNAP